MSQKYSVIGLGKLGASMAAAIAKRGYEVVGVDVNEDAVRSVCAGYAPVQETDLEATIWENRERLRATMSHEDAVLDSDVSFVIVPTPSDDRGAFSLQYAAWAFKALGQALAKKKQYHLIVMTSTVLPGATRHGLLPVLEKFSGKKCGEDFGLCYSPEFIALGSVLKNFLNPDFTLVGEFDVRSGDVLESSYKDIMENKAPCMRMNFENAELAKIAVNTFVTTKITFANMLAEICQRLPGGDVDVVTNALGMDTRIGCRYLKGALGYGGPCFPRDNVALSFVADELGVTASLANTTDALNRGLAGRIASEILPSLQRGSTVAVLGLAYKPGSHVTEESQGIQLVKILADSGMRVVGYDPLASSMARAELKDRAVIMESMSACMKDADAIIITNPDPEFYNCDDGILSECKDGALIFDCWRVWRKKMVAINRVHYVAYGVGSDAAMNSELLKNLWSSDSDSNDVKR